MSAGWNCQWWDDDVHVIPINDSLDHFWPDCACLPQTEAVERDDGSIGWLISHHAWDGRE